MDMATGKISHLPPNGRMASSPPPSLSAVSDREESPSGLPNISSPSLLPSEETQKSSDVLIFPLRIWWMGLDDSAEMGRNRKATAKREEGLKKKARDLATLCGVDVCLVGVAPDGSFFCWPDDISEVSRIAERYLEAAGGSNNDGEAPSLGGTKRKRTTAAARETARSLVPRPKRAKGSQRDLEAADTHKEKERAEGEGSDSGVRVAASPNIHFDFAPAVAPHPEITGTGSAHIGWLTVPPLAPSPPSAILGCPATAAELGYGGHLAEPVLDCGGDIIGEYLLHLFCSPAQDVLPYDLGLPPAVYGSSTLGIPDEDFFHSGGAPVDDWETCPSSAAWAHMAPPETAVGVGYDPGVSACPPSAAFGSSGGTNSGIMDDPLGMAAAGFYDSEAETISLLLSSPSWAASRIIM